jgi:hypothetical protein
MVKVKSYPFAAAINAKPMPVFPDVGSTSKDFPGDIAPSLSAEFIIANPILSFSEQHGSMISNFAATSAFVPSLTLFKYTIGVHPTNCVTESAMFTRDCAFVVTLMLFLLLCFGEARYCFLSKDDDEDEEEVDDGRAIIDRVVVVENIFLFYS